MIQSNVEKVKRYIVNQEEHQWTKTLQGEIACS